MADTTASAPLPDSNAILAELRQVIDPEVGMNIVDLGLVYRVDVAADAVAIDMTMTSPACPMGEMIQDEMRSVLAAEFGSQYAIEIALVWVPVWSPEMMSNEAKQALGWGN